MSAKPGPDLRYTLPTESPATRALITALWVDEMGGDWLMDPFIRKADGVRSMVGSLLATAKALEHAP